MCTSLVSFSFVVFVATMSSLFAMERSPVPVTLTLKNEVTGVEAPIEADGTCKPFGVSLNSTWAQDGPWHAWTLDFTGSEKPVGYTLRFDFPILKHASHLFTPGEKGVVDLSILPTHKPVRYGDFVFGQRTSYVLPLISVFNAAKDDAMLIAIPPDENIPHLQFEWLEGTTLRMTLKHRGIGIERPSSLRLLFASHPADYRSAIGLYAARFPQWFEPVMSSEGFEGSFWYHHILRRPEIDELRRQNVKYIWSSFWFTHLGEYLPKETEWYPYTYSSSSFVQIPDEKMTDEKINKFIDEMHREAIKVFAYFNVTEYGGKGGEGGDPAEANRILREQFADALLKNEHGDAIGTWEGAMAMNANENYSLWPFLVEQMERHLKRLPEFDGFLIDRLDWTALCDYAHDDGMTMIGNRPAENMAVSIAHAVQRVCDRMHRAGKRVFVNQFNAVEPLKDTDGYCHEWDFTGLEYVAPFKPSNAWMLQYSYDTTDLSPHEANLKEHLRIALTPQFIAHEFPVSQQGPHPVAADCNELFTPLFACYTGKRQVLLPHPVAVTGINDCNLFTDTDGHYLVPVISKTRFLTTGNRDTESVTVSLNVSDAMKLTWAHAIPLADSPYRAAVEKTSGGVRVMLPKHGSATMLRVGTGKEPPLPDLDVTRFRRIVDEQFPEQKASVADLTLSHSTPDFSNNNATAAVLALSGRHYRHEGLYQILLNGKPCGTIRSNAETLAIDPTLIGAEPVLTVKASESGTWWVPAKAKISVLMSDGTSRAAVWTPTVSPIEGTPVVQTLSLRWSDAPITKIAAELVGVDTSQSGSWRGRFGRTFAQLPQYQGIESSETAVLSGVSYVWKSETDDTRVLESPEGKSTNRAAACWFDRSRLVGEYTPVSAESRLLTLYALDFDHAGRAYTITICDDFGNVLSTCDLSKEQTSKGAWCTWKVSGPVQWTITLADGSAPGANVALSGIFVDPVEK